MDQQEVVRAVIITEVAIDTTLATEQLAKEIDVHYANRWKLAPDGKLTSLHVGLCPLDTIIDDLADLCATGFRGTVTLCSKSQRRELYELTGDGIDVSRETEILWEQVAKILASRKLIERDVGGMPLKCSVCGKDYASLYVLLASGDTFIAQRLVETGNGICGKCILKDLTVGRYVVMEQAPIEKAEAPTEPIVIPVKKEKAMNEQ